MNKVDIDALIKTAEEAEACVNRAIRELLHALETDGAHHKQYYIEEALRHLCGDTWVDAEKLKRQWIDGAPS